MNDSRPIILITGAGGFTGIHACNYFFSKNYRVIGTYRNATKESMGMWEKREVNLTCYSSVANLIREIQPHYVLHLAGSNSVGDSWKYPSDYFQSNVYNTLNVLEAIRTTSPQTKIVIVSSLLQFSPTNNEHPNHPYGVTKMFQQLLAKYWESLFSMNIVIAKPSNLIGPGTSNGICTVLIKKIIAMEKIKDINPVIEVSHLQNTRDFLDVRDVVKAYEVLLLHGKSSEEYEIASGIPRTLEQLLSIIKSQTSIDFKTKQEKDTKPDIYLSNDLSKIKSLNWVPLIPIEESIQDIFKDIRDEHAKRKLTP
ncbi:NAD-dependent epimerase/dehydratase family protein [Fictibacillus nanhaiensis]|uniref:NAD-dependent epimerase/dehydratase family protein n=1 Tax=Fictibacillus nanhaiensis TaxID=742169 RepID=UPI001C93A601|nr:NAD-dependent epimerase/dehydratase family protein [Fictibacillus nanhaiensis]MBY6036292.1 NAD-dependent epimerase/dehydratase family protein [Fictibacillus nanhaiensis]